jgi:hypothetical protein
MQVLELADPTLEHRKNPSCSVSENKLMYWNLPIKPWSRGKIQAALVPKINAGTGTCRSKLGAEEKSKLLFPKINSGTGTCRSNLGAEEKSKLLWLRK